MALTDSEVDLIERHRKEIEGRSGSDELLLRYYQGQQRIQQLGMAIPPSMRSFMVVTNWCRTLVDTINARQQVRAMVRPGQEQTDPALQDIWDASNLAAHFSMFNIDRLVYGRGCISVGSNEADASLPLVRVESPREMSVFMDVRTETVTSAARVYTEDPESPNLLDGTPRYATLMLPNQTIWAEFKQGRWRELGRDKHKFGTVPVVVHLNRRMSGSWRGESQMTDIIPFVDAATRSLTNLQFAQEAHGIPRMWMTGVAKGDFVDAEGNPVPMFEAYFDAIHTLTKSDAKIGQLSAADLKNFETALNIYGKQASTVTGFPVRYWGLTTANPPAEGTLRGEESSLTRSIEEQNEQVGVTLGKAAALALQFATGEKVSRIKVDWFDPATYTVSQRADAISKLAQGDRPLLSREGAWDELGWSDARKERERRYFAAEESTFNVVVNGDAAVGA